MLAKHPAETCQSACLLQGFYDRSKLFWKDVDDTTLVAACAPPGNGQAPCLCFCLEWHWKYASSKCISTATAVSHDLMTHMLVPVAIMNALLAYKAYGR